MKRLSLISLLILSFFSLSRANNVQIPDKPSLLGKNETDHTVYVNFKLTWENSWRASTPANWDAVWVFAKYREADEWKPIYIDTNALAHQIKANANMSIKVGKSTVHSIVNGEDTEDIQALGAFIYRKEVGRGNITIDSVKLKWHYGKQDIDDGAILSIRVFAIEMVYVPQGAFEPGDRTTNDRALMNRSGTGDFYIGNDYFNIPGTKNTVFKTMGSLSYPTGAISTAGNGANGQAAGWYAESASNGVMLYRNTLWHANTYWTPAINVATYNTPCSTSPEASNCGFHTGNAPLGGNHTFIFKMPSPYKASGVYFSYWYTPYRVQKFVIEASQDSTSWEIIAGDWSKSYANTTELPITNKLFYSIAEAKQKTYTYYRFTFFTGTYAIISCFGIVDETPGGDPENKYYYGREYTGEMPIRWFAYGQVPYGSTPGNYVKTPIESSPTYPNGYEAFYMMKYELSQHGYVDFLNTLNLTQQKNRAGVDPSTGTEGFFHATNTALPPTAFRNYVMLKRKGTNGPAYYYCYQSNARDINDYNLQGGTIAMTWLSWADITAYLCWSGLRPLTELEYEKACKGPNKPISGQFAWGTNSAIVHTSMNPLGLYTDEESVLPTNANFAMQGTGIYPVRVGCFATQASTRSDAGAGYYGNMNLSDNASEFYINCETIEGLQFNGAHGSGELDGNGEAQVATWPDNIGNGGGLILKGLTGSSSATPYAEVAHRTWSPWTSYTSRNQLMGCRGGRTAPK